MACPSLQRRFFSRGNSRNLKCPTLTNLRCLRILRKTRICNPKIRQTSQIHRCQTRNRNRKTKEQHDNIRRRKNKNSFRTKRHNRIQRTKTTPQHRNRTNQKSRTLDLNQRTFKPLSPNEIRNGLKLKNSPPNFI